MAFKPGDLAVRLAALGSSGRYLIAYSGGLDSTVLLHAVVQVAARARWMIEAAHVHHGLQPRADEWAQHCRRECERLKVPFKLIQVNARADKGKSPEAAAREARYAALRKLIEPGMCLLTAHQQDDQAETVLLQLLRGSGPAGLAAMPEVASFGEGWHARPLLRYTRAELADYAQHHELQWMDDPSNRDLSVERNYVRHRLFFDLRARWPACTRTLYRGAVLQAEAAQLLEDLARLDLIEVVGSRPDTLSVSQLRRLTVQRQRNAIRHWLIGLKLAVPARRQLEHVLTDAINARWDSAAVVTWPGGEIRRYRDDLYAMKPRPEHDPTVRMRWDGCGPLHIPSLNISLDPFMLRALGLATEVIRSQVTVRFRRGGERCRPAGRRHNRELKKLFQEAGVPPWERDRIPLVYVRESLAIVVGHWTCEV